MSKPLHPIDLLLELEAAGHEAALAMPSQAPLQREWTGVSFRVGGQSYVAPLDEVVETVPSLSITTVPGVRPWFLGIANHRGDLLPVVDLQQYGGGKPTIRTRRTRLLVTERNDLRVAMIVNDVSGMRHFTEDQLRPVRVGRQILDKYVIAQLQDDQLNWRVFSFDRLTADPDFRVAWVYDQAPGNAGSLAEGVSASPANQLINNTAGVSQQ